MIIDINTMYDPESPRLSAGVDSTEIFCELTEILLRIARCREIYVHGWGNECLDAIPVIGTWELNTFDIKDLPCSFEFDIIRGSSPIIIGLDVGKYAIQNNLAHPPYLNVRRRSDATRRAFDTYVSADAGSPLSDRIQGAILPRLQASVTALISSSLARTIERSPNLVLKRIHRLTHTTAAQIKSVCDHAGVLTD